MSLSISTATTYVNILTIIAVGISAAAFFRPPEAILESMDEVNVKKSWLPMLGTLKAAGALGLLIGIGAPVPAIGTAAAVGLVVYFVGASIVHLLAGDYSFSGQHVYLLLAVVTLVLNVVS
ncbi:DoxX family protein [Halocatena salina]|uniref:DoxX family protein n=1 Tax=Halocatena salina TaxID=2934340 RepID=A0A8U0A6G5_9EURY|nr:DoxX family protein [Halocatena salina]UPM44771.1 DoxX family protein [Halocatena salina]